MKDEFAFAQACKYWGYRPHEMEERPDRGFLIQQALMLIGAENTAQKISMEIARQRSKNGNS